MRSKRFLEKESYEVGKVYGRLTITGISYMTPMYGRLARVVEVTCECGNVNVVVFNSLAQGATRSCGCLARELSSERFTTHGLTDHPLFDIRQSMLGRCFLPNHKNYKDYGGRGITVCEEWQEDFCIFYDWAIANGWKKGYDLDRKDNDGNYEPSNCRFVNRKVSNRNTRRNRMYTAFGETKCLFDWGKDPRSVLNEWGLRARVDSGNWPDFEKALTEPVKSRKEVSRNMKTNRNLTAFGETKCLRAWLEDPRCLVKRDSFRDRLAKGWDTERALSTPPSRDGKNKMAA